MDDRKMSEAVRTDDDASVSRKRSLQGRPERSGGRVTCLSFMHQSDTNPV